MSERRRRLGASGVLAVLSLGAFLALTAWTRKLPVLHGSAWNLKDLGVRTGAVVAGVIFVLCVVSAAIPLVLDRLEAGPFPSFIAARHVRAKKSGFLTLVSVLSIFAVALATF